MALKETFAPQDREFIADGAGFASKFIFGKGILKYPGIYGVLSALAYGGIALTGDDIVHSLDPYLGAVDSGISDLVGVEVAPATDVFLPFAFFVKHINSLHWTQAAAEFAGFLAIGYGFKKLSKKLHD